MTTTTASRIRHIPVTVADVVQETADTVTLLLDAGDFPRDYKAGQYVSIDPHQFRAIAGYAAYFEDAKGRKEPPRAYSMCSSPDEPYLAITIKEEYYERGKTKYPPLLSPFLVHHQWKGVKLEVTAAEQQLDVTIVPAHKSVADYPMFSGARGKGKAHGHH